MQTKEGMKSWIGPLVPHQGGEISEKVLRVGWFHSSFEAQANNTEYLSRKSITKWAN